MAAVLVTGGLALSGCKTSETLTELLFDQDSENVDEDNADRFLHNVLDSLDMTEELAQMLDKKTTLQRDRKADEAVKGEDKVKDEIAKSVYEKTANSKSEASETGVGESTSSSEGTGSDDSSDSTKNNGKTNSKKKKASSNDSGKSGKGKGDKGDEGDSTVYHGDGGSGDVYNDNGTYTDVPTGVQTVVAFGECANMVVSFAGEHALAGADSEFLSNSFIKTAYKSEDIANAKKVSVSDKGVIDGDKVLELAPDAVLICGGSYSFSSEDLAKLKEAKIDVVHLPSFNSASHITKIAGYIGKMFGSDTLSGDDAQKAADQYVSWHDDLVASVQKKNGGITGDTNFDTGKDNFGPEGNHTIYVSQWDDATYFATPDEKLSWKDTHGVAVSKVGYKWSPMSYYLSLGGTQNVSATFKSAFYSTSANYYVWQFNLGRVPTVYKKNWSGTTVSVSKLSNSGVSDLLVKANDGSALGDSDFSYVVAANQTVAKKMKASLTASAKTGNGLYATYGSVKGYDGSGRGFLSKTGGYCSAAITGSFDVKTNPCGLYSSWINGSPESVLESVWISDENNGTSELSSEIKEYYKLFYDVDLTDKQVSTIVAGAKK